jgi:hypothetical protein
MTDQELNEWIAKKRGWVLHPHEKLGSMHDPSTKWYNPKTNGSFWTQDPPFCTSWQYAGELLEELGSNGDTLVIYFEETKWYFDSEKDNVFGISEKLTRAIAESWAMWSEQCG